MIADTSRRQQVLIALFYVAAALVFFGVWLQSSLRQAEYVEPDAYTALERYLLRYKLKLVDTPTPSDDVVVVSFGAQARKLLGPYPWPRDLYADLVLRLRKSGARTVAPDLLFADPQLRFVSPSAYRSLLPDLPLEQIRIINHRNYFGELKKKLEQHRKRLKQAGATPEKLAAFRLQENQLLLIASGMSRGDSNAAFERALSRKRDVILPIDLNRKVRKARVETGTAETLQHHAVAAPALDVSRRYLATALYPRLMDIRPRIGFNGVYRKQQPFVSRAQVLARHRLRTYASHTVTAVAHFLGEELRVEGDAASPRVVIGQRRIALERDGSLPIQYYDRPGWPRVYSAIDVFRGKVGAAALRGKLVLVDVRIGGRTTGQMHATTPLSRGVWPTEIKATVASNMLLGHRGPTVERPRWLRWLEGTCVWLFAALFAWLARRPLTHSLAAGPLLVAALGAADLLLALPSGIWFSSGILVIEVPLLMISSVGAHYLIQRAERQKVRRAFGFYLPPNVLRHMLDHESALKLGGARRNVSILFSDIRSFTTISERSDPERLGEALNAHLTALTRVVFEHQGTLDKYMGDCIMAFFGAPVSNEEHARGAVLAALQMQRRLKELQPSWRRCSDEDVAIGVGVATGEVIVGNMGSESLFDYTVVGDNVNLASRLEGLTKDYGVEVLVSRQTQNDCGDAAVFMEVDVVRVKGKNEPVKIYEALDRDAVDEERTRYIEACEAGIEAYRGCRWGTAREHFSAASQLRPDARLPALYLDRVERLEADPPPAGWDGVTRFSHK